MSLCAFSAFSMLPLCSYPLDCWQLMVASVFCSILFLMKKGALHLLRKKVHGDGSRFYFTLRDMPPVAAQCPPPCKIRYAAVYYLCWSRYVLWIRKLVACKFLAQYLYVGIHWFSYFSTVEISPRLISHVQ
jgi:hypothetical protein